MSATYEPGTVAIATVRGTTDVRVMRDPEGYWSSSRRIEGWLSHGDAYVTDILPLVVLDHSHIDDALTGLRRVLKSDLPMIPDEIHALHELANQIEEQTKPPRIPEPGHLAVVAASCVHNPERRVRWVHEYDNNWYPIGSGENPDDWDSLINPTVIRPGIEVAS